MKSGPGSDEPSGEMRWLLSSNIEIFCNENKPPAKQKCFEVYQSKQNLEKA